MQRKAHSKKVLSADALLDPALQEDELVEVKEEELAMPTPAPSGQGQPS